MWRKLYYESVIFHDDNSAVCGTAVSKPTFSQLPLEIFQMLNLFHLYKYIHISVEWVVFESVAIKMDIIYGGQLFTCVSLGSLELFYSIWICDLVMYNVYVSENDHFYKNSYRWVEFWSVHQ